MTLTQLIEALQQYQKSTPDAPVYTEGQRGGNVSLVTDVRWYVLGNGPTIITRNA